MTTDTALHSRFVGDFVVFEVKSGFPTSIGIVDAATGDALHRLPFSNDKIILTASGFVFGREGETATCFDIRSGRVLRRHQSYAEFHFELKNLNEYFVYLRRDM